MTKRRLFSLLTLAFLAVVLTFGPIFAQAKQTGSPASGPLPYQMVLFRLGPAWDTAKPVMQQPGIQDHIALMNKLTREGTMVFGGPFVQGGKFVSAFYVLDVRTADEARKIAEADPAVTGKLMEIEEVRTFLLFATSWKPVVGEQKP